MTYPLSTLQIGAQHIGAEEIHTLPIRTQQIPAHKQITLAVFCALAFGLMPSAVQANVNPRDAGYLIDSSGAVVRSGHGLCWHTGSLRDTPHRPECDERQVAEVAPPAPAPAPWISPPAAPPVVSAPAPAPAPAPEPRRGPERMMLDADALFDFDKAVLRPAGRLELDNFASRLKEMNPDMIMVLGHADRFGSDDYNQRLSEQRAHAVKDYLIGKGIESNRMRAEGKGELQPITKPGECLGNKSAKVIACLQPDRRVEVDVEGSKIAR